MLGDIFNLIWPTGSLVAWFAGAAVLQTRARNYPLDLRLNAMLLMLVVVTFHFVAYAKIAVDKQALNLAALPLFDLALIVVALIGVKRRVQLTQRSFLMFVLVLVGSLSFWLWLIPSLGGLFPK